MKKIKLLAIFSVITALMMGCSGGDNTEEKTGVSNQTSISMEEKEEIKKEESRFEVHYLDVGQADATLIMCDGKNMLIDGGNVEDSSLIYSYLKEQDVDYIDYMICTHAHEDHVGGLAGALNYAQVGEVYCPVTNYDSEAFSDFVKYLGEQDKEITVPEAGTKFKLGSAECTILGLNVVDNGDPNNTSIVLKVEYGDTAFLFSGDAEQSVETSIIEEGYDIECTVMKVPHHGSDTSLSYRWLNEAMPEYGIISVGANNSYGHPCEDTLSKLRDADVTVFRTDLQGHIICTSDGKSVSFEVEKNEDADTLADAGAGSVNTQEVVEETAESVTEGNYIINTNTGKFHYPSCHSVDDMKESNKQETQLTRDELVAQGYSPCGNCKP